jgi:acyl dehydratase
MSAPALLLETAADAADHVGREMGPSEWVTVDQAMIDRFAEATGDHQWIHVDVERAGREMPGGRTIAHGYLTLSLLPRLSKTLVGYRRVTSGINYGANRVRFTAPVPAGSRVRLRQTFRKVEPVDGGAVRVTSECVIELEGSERPALVAEVIGLIYP